MVLIFSTEILDSESIRNLCNVHTHTHTSMPILLNLFLSSGVLSTVSFPDYNLLCKPIQVTQLQGDCEPSGDRGSLSMSKFLV